MLDTSVNWLVLREVLKFLLGLFESLAKLVLVHCHVIEQSIFDFSDFLCFCPDFFHFLNFSFILSDLCFGWACNFAEISSCCLIVFDIFPVLPTAQVLNVCLIILLAILTLRLP